MPTTMDGSSYPNFNAEYYFLISIQPDSPTLICTIH